MAETEEEKNKAIVDYLTNEFVKYENFHKDRFKEAKEIMDNWDCVPPPAEHDWQNQVPSPATLEAEQTITPRMFTALFPTDAPLDLICEGDTPAEDGVVIKSLIQHYFRVGKVRGKSLAPMSQNTLLGTGYAEAGSWYIRKGYVVENGVRQRRIVENRPAFEPIDFFEIFPHPNKRTVEDELPLFRRYFVGEEALKKLTENPFFKWQLLQEALESDCPVQDDTTDYDDQKSKRYEVLMYWGPYDITYTDKDAKGEDKTLTDVAVPHWSIVINRKVLLRHGPNPYNHQRAPYVKMNLFPDIRPSWFGVGVGKIGKPTQARLNKIINQRLDNVDLVLNKQGCYNGSDPLINPKQLQVSKPGKWFKVSDVMQSMRWMDTPDVTASSYKEEELAQNAFRESVGAISAIMPSEDKNDQHSTAMGIQMLQGAAGMRFKPILTKMEEDYVAEIANFFFTNCKQFMVVREWVEIMGEDAKKMVEVTPDQIMRKVKFIPTGVSETINKEIQVAQLLRFKEITIQDPTINRAVINKRIADLMGFKDIDELIIKQQPQQGPPQAGGLSPEQQAMIKQRLAEGADPNQIKMEMIGPPPAPEPQEQGAA